MAVQESSFRKRKSAKWATLQLALIRLILTVKKPNVDWNWTASISSFTLGWGASTRIDHYTVIANANRTCIQTCDANSWDASFIQSNFAINPLRLGDE